MGVASQGELWVLWPGDPEKKEGIWVYCWDEDEKDRDGGREGEGGRERE